MTVLSNDYTRLKNPNAEQGDVVEAYKTKFATGDIDGAKAEVTTTYPFIAMSASDLNNLCDTITYMQNIWATDKTTFGNKVLALGTAPSPYSTTTTYNIGSLATYNSNPYLCIVDGTTGTWDATKWVLLTPNNLGINIKGLYNSVETYSNGDVTYTINNGVTTWQIYNGSTWSDITEVHPSIRYLSDSTEAYSGEIYIAPYTES